MTSKQFLMQLGSFMLKDDTEVAIQDSDLGVLQPERYL